ncbi:MAG: hypothetical protein EZS28_049495, partial [Streblomastix strix]
TSDDIKSLFFQLNPYPGLTRLLEHSHFLVIRDVIVSILNILAPVVNVTPETQPHSHFDIMNECGGVQKLYLLFRRDESKDSKDYSAVCLGFLFRAREINDKQMRKEIIEHLKKLSIAPSEEIKRNSIVSLRGLSRNAVNKVQIESGRFKIPPV